MNSFKARVSLLGIAMAIAAVIAGCQSTGETDGTPVADTQAVHCAKCQTTWVQKPTSVGTRGATIYRTEKAMVCADCESAAATFFKTGKLEHSCKSCGGAPKHCVVHAGPPVTAAANAAEQVVTCPKCETTWVKEQQLVGSPGRSNTYIIRNKQKMTCPDCKSAAANFFATGKLQHACPSCGTDMKACEKHAN
jgi:hypothetical protein